MIKASSYAVTSPDNTTTPHNGADKELVMEIRHAHSQREVQGMNTDELRKAFLIDKLITPGGVNGVYSHYDRLICGGVAPLNQPVGLPNYTALAANFFLERREMGVINIAGAGSVVADGKEFTLQKLDCLYISKGTKSVSFKSNDPVNPAVFYFVSSPAHHEYATAKLTADEAEPAEMGSSETANKRTVYKYVHETGLSSCQLVMGLTLLKPGSVWNTMPAHTHDRRTEVYFYFDVEEGNRVVHFMGQPRETRHLLMANHQAVVSPPWSIHAGCGTSSYAFIWAMAGENYSYSDMDKVAIADLL
jgi:4-deoxy-L-threo-5-hexosulose-uronate ketol-isomerase